MPEFTDPFRGTIPKRKLTHEELVRAIRLGVAAEHEAISIYMAHAEATDHPLVRKVLIDIAKEERVHIGEFVRLLEILTGDEDKYVAEGREEVDEMEAELLVAKASEAETSEASSEELTIGSLKG
jgi:rubrerythrin